MDNERMFTSPSGPEFNMDDVIAKNGGDLGAEDGYLSEQDADALAAVNEAEREWSNLDTPEAPSAPVAETQEAPILEKPELEPNDIALEEPPRIKNVPTPEEIAAMRKAAEDRGEIDHQYSGSKRASRKNVQVRGIFGQQDPTSTPKAS